MELFMLHGNLTSGGDDLQELNSNSNQRSPRSKAVAAKILLCVWSAALSALTGTSVAFARQPVDFSAFSFNKMPLFHNRSKLSSLSDGNLSTPQSLPEYGLNLEDLPPLEQATAAKSETASTIEGEQFTGEPPSQATLMPGAKTKVQR